MRKTSVVAMGLIAAALVMSGCGTRDADTLRDEFMAWSNGKNSPAVSSCVFTGVEETHGRDVIRALLDLAPKVDTGPEDVEILFKIMPIAMLCVDAEDNGSG